MAGHKQQKALIANRFEVLEELGRGGMGTVYRVLDTIGDTQELALKTMRNDTGADASVSAEHRLRFREEFRAMTRLRHPNTVEVYDCGFLDGQTEYLTMELVPGCELTTLIAEGPLPLSRVYDLTLQLLLALEFIHSRHYIHRDIKPDNLRVRDDGVLKLMDFGLMAWAGSRSHLRVAGTVGYMAPESVLGGVLDSACDLYAVGCVLYEMLSGRLPFLGPSMKVLQAHLSEAPPSLRALRHDIPPRLEALVMRLLAKMPRERPQEASAVADEIATISGAQRIRQDLVRSRSYLISDAMVGREAQLDLLTRLAADASSGDGRSVFIAGPAGVGKSRLMQELIIRTKLEGAQVLYAACGVQMGSYEPIARALAPLEPLSTATELARYGPTLAALDRAPTAATGDKLGDKLGEAASIDKLVLARDVAAWLEAVSGRVPLVLSLEDLQWCDRPSLELLNWLISTLRGSAVLIVATFRDDEAALGSPLWYTLRDGQTAHMLLRGLDREQVRRLTEAMLRGAHVSDELATALYDSTAGNAFFLTELLRDLMEQEILVAGEHGWMLPSVWQGQAHALPKTIDAVVFERISRLDPGAHALAQVAAVLGRYQDLEALLALSGSTEAELFADLELLTQRQLLVREDRRYSFPHDRVRETLYARAPAALKRDLHQRYAEYLERRHHAHLDAVVDELAHHFGLGSSAREAFEYTRLAAERARATGAEATAIAYSDRALELLETLDFPDKEAQLFELRDKLGEDTIVLWPRRALELAAKCRAALEARGDPDRIFAVMRGVVAVVERLPAPIRARAMAELTRVVPYRHELPRGVLGRMLPPPVSSWAPKLIAVYAWDCVASGLAGEPRRGLALGERALALMPFAGTPLQGALFTAYAGSLHAAGHFDAIDEATARARELLFDRDLRGQSVALSARVGAAAFSNYRVFKGVRFDPKLVEYCVWAADEIHKPDFYNQAWAYPCVWYAWTGRQHEALELLERIVHNCRTIGAPPFPWALYLDPYLAWQRGAFEQARATLVQTLRDPHIERMMLARESACVLEGHVHLALGELDRAAKDFADIEVRARRSGMELILIQALLGRGEVAILQDQLPSAGAHIDAALARARSGPARNPLHEAIALRLSARVELQREAFAAAERALTRAMGIVCSEAQDNLIEQGHMLVLRAELDACRGDHDGAARALDDAGRCYATLANEHLVRATRARRAALGFRPAGSAPRAPDDEGERRHSSSDINYADTVAIPDGFGKTMPELPSE